MQLMNNYPPLEGVCKKAIEQGICTGCNKLETPWFRGVKECKWITDKTTNKEVQLKL